MRLFGIVAIGFWLVMMTLLVRKDVLPAYGRYGDPSYRTLLLRKPGLDDTTMGIWMGEQKVGSSHQVIRGDADGHYQITDETDLNAVKVGLAALLGVEGGSKQDQSLLSIRSMTDVDAKFQLSSFDLSVRIFGVESRVKGIVVGDELIVRTEGLLAQEGQEEKRLVLDGPMTLSAGLAPFTGMPDLAIGREWTIVSVDPLSAVGGRVTPTTQRAKVVAKETMNWLGKPTDVFVVEIDTKNVLGKRCTAWITPGGDVLKERMDLLEMRREK